MTSPSVRVFVEDGQVMLEATPADLPQLVAAKLLIAAAHGLLNQQPRPASVVMATTMPPVDARPGNELRA